MILTKDRVRYHDHHACHRGSGAGAPLRRALLAGTALAAAAGLALPALAGPSGGTVTAGGATITTPDATTTRIDQSTDRAAIDWTSFDVAADELVEFNQPGASSATLNRVLSGTESVIRGRITAPGQVIILNNNGVAFTDTARIDVGSIIASAADIATPDFMDGGSYTFDGGAAPGAVVSNAGEITAAEAGLVALVGPQVRNSGAIVARRGTVGLLSGDRVTMDFYGDGLVQFAVERGVDGADPVPVSHTGTIEAGYVVMDARRATGVVDRAINLDGLVLAEGGSVRDGHVVLAGDGGVTLGSAAEVDAGDGTVWIEAAGDVGQAAGTSVRGDAVAVIGEDVALTSADNRAGVLAGRATDGDFAFAQTNESGTVTVAGVDGAPPVEDPRTSQDASPRQIAFVTAQRRIVRGEIEVLGTGIARGPDNAFTDAYFTPAVGEDLLLLTAGGETFDTIVFTAGPYIATGGGTPPDFDSSDYYVTSLSWTTAEGSFDLGIGGDPPTPGVTSAGEGSTVVFDEPFGIGVVSDEGDRIRQIEHDPVAGVSERLIVDLQGDTTEASTRFAGLLASENGGFQEVGTVTLIDRVDGAVTLTADVAEPPDPGPEPGPGPGPGPTPGPLTPDAGATGPSFAFSDLLELPERGRDPDTPGDAVYRTTRFENPFVYDPLARSYALGGVTAAGGGVQDLESIAPAAGPDGTVTLPFGGPLNDTTGQHAARGSGPVVAGTPVNLAGLADGTAALESIAPAAGPGGQTDEATSTDGLTGSCSAGELLADYWSCIDNPFEDG